MNDRRVASVIRGHTRVRTSSWATTVSRRVEGVIGSRMLAHCSSCTAFAGGVEEREAPPSSLSTSKSDGVLFADTMGSSVDGSG